MDPRNDLTDVPGFRVGSAENEEALTGCTVILCPDEGAVGGVDQQGGAPGTRETDPLRPMHLVDRCHAVLVTGGSAFGLDAAGGVVRYLEGRGIGFPTRATHVPIVPAAVIFDLAMGDPSVRPDAAMGEAACLDAEKGEAVRQGNAGAGCGATVGKVNGLEGAMKSGLGTASTTLHDGIVVGAVVVVNAFGDVIDPAVGGIMAGARVPGAPLDATAFADTLAVLQRQGGLQLNFGRPDTNTVIAVVATNAKLDKQETNILARMANAGITRTIRPAHTMVDGDTVIALASGDRECDVSLLGAVAADVIGMSVLRAVLCAQSIEGFPGASDIKGEARGLRIRDGSADDEDAIAELGRGLPEWFTPESIGEMARDLKLYNSLIAEIGGRMVGMLIYGPSDFHPEPGLVKVYWIGVARSHRGRGIGQALMRRLHDIYREGEGATIDVMTVADTCYYPPYADTRAFYRALGYEEFYTDAGAIEQYGTEMLNFRKVIAGTKS